jgi:hypothetical protein
VNGLIEHSFAIANERSPWKTTRNEFLCAVETPSAGSCQRGVVSWPRTLFAARAPVVRAEAEQSAPRSEPTPGYLPKTGRNGLQRSSPGRTAGGPGGSRFETRRQGGAEITASRGVGEGERVKRMGWGWCFEVGWSTGTRLPAGTGESETLLMPAAASQGNLLLALGDDNGFLAAAHDFAFASPHS